MNSDISSHSANYENRQRARQQSKPSHWDGTRRCLLWWLAVLLTVAVAHTLAVLFVALFG